MFGKLVKHEFRATGRFALPLCGAMLALALLAGTVLRFWNSLQNGWQGMAGNAIVILYGMSLFAVAVGIFVILMQRYKQNFFGDEGEHALLLSKLLTAVCWYVAALALMALSVLLAGALAGGFTRADARDALDALRYYFPRIGASAALRALLGTLGGMSFVTLLCYAVATIAQNFSKHRFWYFVMTVVLLLALARLLAGLNLFLDARLARSVGVIGGADGPTAIYVTGGAPWLGLVELYLGNALLYFLTWAFLKFRPNLA